MVLYVAVAVYQLSENGKQMWCKWTVRSAVLFEFRQLVEIFLAKLLINIRPTQMLIIKIQSQLHVSAGTKPCSGRTQLYVANNF
jgi:hypothetical protein